MIYEIETVQLTIVVQKNGNILIISADGLYALVNNLNDTEGLNIINTYEDSEYNELTALPLWQQPCTNC